VVPFDRDRLAAAIDEALASPAATRELGEKAAIAVKAELSWDRGAERLKDLYQSLVTAKK
jgi:glycosyltransferase involved in cell wall biosynthesis